MRLGERVFIPFVTLSEVIGEVLKWQIEILPESLHSFSISIYKIYS